ncbi:MAG: ABC transporter ATP-binding protein, partial [Anaerolineales bacterium]
MYSSIRFNVWKMILNYPVHTLCDRIPLAQSSQVSSMEAPMGMHRGGWGAFMRYDEKNDQPQISWTLIKRVLKYAQPYGMKAGILITSIIISSLLDLISPLLYRDLLDNALPNKDIARLNVLAIGLVGLPIIMRLIGVAQSYLSSSVGEGIIYDLRRSLYSHLQMMSLRFFTHTKTGEMMSRLNNDVNGAQQAIT